MATDQRRKVERVVFQRGFDAHMMAIDGTWRRACILKDVSEDGAKLIMASSIEGLPLKEFFLLLSSSGLAYRRCELVWVNGDQIGVAFIKIGDGHKKAARQERRSRRLILSHVLRLAFRATGYDSDCCGA
jgi:PilZ domain-containing protein